MMERLLAKYIEIMTLEDLSRQEGQTAVEYVLVLAMVIAMIGGVLYATLSGKINSAIDALDF